MKRLIFSVYIEIDDTRLDDPGRITEEGVWESSDKSKIAKNSFLQYKTRLIDAQRSYAALCGATYVLYDDPLHYETFANWFRKAAPQISEYDIINFYKHYVMQSAEVVVNYDQVCYMDLDIIPNTHENIFEQFDLDAGFAVPHSNADAEWGKKVAPKYFNTCIRNPATKYWNAHAMLSEDGLEPDRDVYNTGLMIASSKMIRRLLYFHEFDKNIWLMKKVKEDPDSMYPENYQRVFNYDNETLFSYRVAVSGTPIHLIGPDWHQVVRYPTYDENAKVFHVIDKVFGRFFR